MSRTKSLFTLISLIVIASLALAACTFPASQPVTQQPGSGSQPPAGEPPTPGSELPPITGLAGVERIEILVLESFPVQIRVAARGNFPDGCTKIDQVTTSFKDNTFLVTLTTTRPAEASCTQALVPFEEVIPLEAVGLPAGLYTVNVNSVIGTFELAVDNILEEPTPAPASGSIEGVVWHDLCAVAGGEGGAPLAPSAGCTRKEGGDYLANGRLDTGEPGLEGVQVDLGQGACPAAGLASVTTDKDGKFRFSDLAPGQYCVSVDAENVQNTPVLIPGAWTAPQVDQGSQSVTLADGATKPGVNFGWDYALLPVAEQSANCTNIAAFVEDVTIPDDTVVGAGQKFTKTWRLRNEGTCTWGAGYNLVFDDLTQMDGASPAALSKPVAPKQSIDVSIELTAPGKAGTYRGEWKLADAAGKTFGIGKNAEASFWVQIVVVESVGSLGLGAADWTDNFDGDSQWFLVNTANTEFELDDSDLVMRAKNPGAVEEWGLSFRDPVRDFYIEASFETGKSCAGLDRYGLLLRAPDPNAGYVFGFSCDGRYRIYKWDGENYQSIVEWTASSLILKGPQQTNKVGFYAQGDTLKLYANGYLLVELTDGSYSRGRFGLFVAAAQTEDFETRVTQVSLWELD
jgi:hypothetical protein